jgi:tetratricopeptide (TPR) repeat protein
MTGALTVTAPDAGADPRDGARGAFELIGSDPGAALAAADRIVAAVPARGATPVQLEAVSMAHRVAALALTEVPDLHAAESRIRLAVSVARRARSSECEAQARMTLAFVLMGRGRLVAALAAADRALPGLAGADRGRLLGQRALILQKVGRDDEALESFGAALELLDAHGDLAMTAKAHHNRATLLAYRGDLVRAIEDQRRAVDLHAALGERLFAAQSLSDLGWLVGMTGRIPESLRILDEAADSLPDDDPVAWLDRADILMRAGLVHEAVATATQAAEWLDAQRTGWDTMAAEAQLGLAQTLLRTDALDAAAAHAGAARAMFRAQGRPSWLALADHVRAMAALLGEAAEAPVPAPRRDSDERAVRREQLRTVAALESRGWRTLALDLRIALASAALAAGDGATAAKAVASPPPARGDTLEIRSRTRHLRSLASRSGGDRVGAARHLRAAWELVDRQRALVGASELRVSSARQVEGIVQEGVRAAAAAGSAAQVLAWAERGRAASLRFPRALPPDDPELADTLGRLRMAARSRDEALLAQRADGTGTTELARLEQHVVRLTRRASGVSGDPPLRAADVRAVLGDDVLVELVAHGPELFAVVLDPRRSHLVGLGPVADVRRAVDRCEFVLRRMTSGHGAGGAVAGRPGLLDTVLDDLDRLLLAPVRRRLGDGHVLVSPTGPLWRVPWASLPSLADRVVVVTPSATVWHRARTAPRPERPTVLAVAGPSLAHADAEVAQVATAHRGTRTLVGPAATVGAVATALASVDVAHLAVHGSLRGDNPLFSGLELADGPLMGYDLERLARAPHTVVLPACHSGEGRALPGEEMLGLAWTLLGAGASSVVAATSAVPDGATAALMARFHEQLARGATPAESLAAARATADQDDPLAVATAAAFACVGS